MLDVSRRPGLPCPGRPSPRASLKKPAVVEIMASYLAALALQVGMQPILQKRLLNPKLHKVQLLRIYLSDPRRQVTFVLACELCKFLMASALLKGSGEWRSARRNFSIGDSAAVGMIPAAIYALQNLCIQEFKAGPSQTLDMLPADGLPQPLCAAFQYSQSDQG